MEMVLSLFSVGFLLGTMALHLNFWADYGKGDIEKSLVGSMFTLPLFPIFGIIQMVRKFPFRIKIERKQQNLNETYEESKN
jgi:hypothetical protein